MFNKKNIFSFLLTSIACLLVMGTTLLHAQNKKTFWYGLQLRGSASTGNLMPFWLYANRHATVDPYSPGGSLILDFHKRANDDSGFDYGFGATLVGRYSEHETLTFNQLYGTISYRSLQLKGGRFYDQVGTVYSPLSMGSLVLSSNAVPIPKVKFGIFNYAPVPFTKGFVEIKAAISHGWFGKNRRFSNAWLHEKYIYLRFGGDFAFRPYIGLVHEALWAGTMGENYDAPDSFNDFGRIFLALQGKENAMPAGEVYVLGDHRGIWDIGFYLTISGIDFTVYRQFIYDDKEGVLFERLRDGMLGVSVELPGKKQQIVTAFLWEYLNTKWQGGSACPGEGRGGAGGCENYYNNIVYRTGWAYQGKTLGNPLFLTVNAPGITKPARKMGFTNNRIIAQHFGLMGNVSTNVAYKLLATWSRNYGIYKRLSWLHITPNEFQTPQDQWSFLAKFSYHPAGYQAIRFNLSLAADTGELYPTTYGVMFGIELTGTSSF